MKERRLHRLKYWVFRICLQKTTRWLVPAAVLSVLAGASALSLPRLSVEHGLPCRECHINPNGGGMRNEFGNFSVAFNELCLPQTKQKVVGLHHSPRLSEAVTFGFDTRHLIFDDGRVFRMQTDLFLNLEPMKNFQYHLRFWETGISENFALVTFQDQKYFVKAGRFYPAFGLRNEDHTAYNRSRTGHAPILYLDGVSAGIELAGVSVTAEAFDRDHRGIYGIHLYRSGHLASLGYLAGASLRLSESLNGSNGAFPHAKAVFGGLSYDRITAMGELDLVGQGNDTLVAYGSLTTRLEYGLYAIGEYNFFDGNRSLQDGVEEFARVSLELYPVPYFLLRPSYTYYTRGPLQDVSDFFLQVHFGY